MNKLACIFVITISFISTSCSNSSKEINENQDHNFSQLQEDSLVYPLDSLLNNRYWKTVYLRNNYIGTPIDSLIELFQPQSFSLGKDRHKSSRFKYAVFKELCYAFEYNNKNNLISNGLVAPGWSIAQDSSGVIQQYCGRNFSLKEFNQILNKHELGTPDTLTSKFPFQGTLLHFEKGRFTMWIEELTDSIQLKRVDIGSSKTLPFYNKKNFNISDIFKLPPPPFKKQITDDDLVVNTYYPNLKKHKAPHPMDLLPNFMWIPSSKKNNYLMDKIYFINDSLKKLNYNNLSNIVIKGGNQINRSHIVSMSYEDNLMTLENCKNMVFENLIFGHYTQSKGNIITLKNCKNITFKNCVIYGSGSIGIKAENCEGVLLERVGIYDCEQSGLQLKNCSNTTIKRSRFYESKNWYLSVFNSKNTRIDSTHFDNNPKFIHRAIYAPPSYTEADSINTVVLNHCVAKDFTPENFSWSHEGEGDEPEGYDQVIRNDLKFTKPPRTGNYDCGTE